MHFSRVKKKKNDKFPKITFHSFLSNIKALGLEKPVASRLQKLMKTGKHLHFKARPFSLRTVFCCEGSPKTQPWHPLGMRMNQHTWRLCSLTAVSAHGVGGPRGAT